MNSQTTPALLPSPPSNNVVTQLQIAMNNLFGQLREVLVFVPEFAPAISISGMIVAPSEDEMLASASLGLAQPAQLSDKEAIEDRRVLIRNEVLMRSQRIAILFDSIDSLSKQLPAVDCSKQQKFDKLNDDVQYWNSVNESLTSSLECYSQTLNSFLSTLDDSIEMMSQNVLKNNY